MQKGPISPLPPGGVALDECDRQRVILLATGSADAVAEIVRQLFIVNFAQPSKWSPAVAANTPGQVVRVLTRYLTVEE